MSDNEAVIAGVAESDEVGKVPDKNVLQLQAEAAKRAVSSSGLSPDMIEGLFVQGAGFRERFYFPQVTVGEYLGIEPKISSSNDMGGATAYGHIQYAKYAIEAGTIDAALITYGSTNYSDRKQNRVKNQVKGAYGEPILNRQYEHPYGIFNPLASYAMVANRYMHEYGVSRADLAEIAVSTREWAKLNPDATLRDDLSVSDILEAEPISTPLTIHDCCLISDAGGAVVLMSRKLAREHCSLPPVQISGLGQAQTHELIHQMPDLLAPGALQSSQKAFEMSGMTPADIDVAELYDSFTITTALLAESVGLAKKGEATSLFKEKDTYPGGSIPINTNGGGLSYIHPGSYGIFTIIEAVRQVRGDADKSQVPDVEVALAHGTGGKLSTHATMILEEAS